MTTKAKYKYGDIIDHEGFGQLLVINVDDKSSWKYDADQVFQFDVNEDDLFVYYGWDEIGESNVDRKTTFHVAKI
tara:strand:+ start:165 stop:389 length:225 start_codon:yes stop_codon:yes gene_type:complete